MLGFYVEARGASWVRLEDVPGHAALLRTRTLRTRRSLADRTTGTNGYRFAAWAGDFEAVFAGTDLGREPTDERHRYVVLRFNFSAFNNALPTLERRFEEYCALEVRGALERNPDLFPEPVYRRILAPPDIGGKAHRAVPPRQRPTVSRCTCSSTSRPADGCDRAHRA